MKKNPSISVIIPSYNSKGTITECLDSVLNQSFQGTYDVIVVDSSNDGTDEIIRKSFPMVKLIHLDKKTLPGAARNIGAMATDSEYVAFTDTDCIADYYWIENLINRLKSGNYNAIGGPLLNGTPESISGTLGYFNEFSFFLPDKPSGFVTCLATANVCYKRSLFENLQFFEKHFAGEDTVFHWSIIENGGKLFFDPNIKVTHLNRTGFINVLKHQKKIGEGAGFARIFMKRDLLLIKHPLVSIFALPWVRLLRMYLRVFSYNSKLLIKTILFLPLSFLIAFSWSLGAIQSILKYRNKSLINRKEIIEKNY